MSFRCKRLWYWHISR